MSSSKQDSMSYEIKDTITILCTRTKLALQWLKAQYGETTLQSFVMAWTGISPWIPADCDCKMCRSIVARCSQQGTWWWWLKHTFYMARIYFLKLHCFSDAPLCSLVCNAKPLADSTLEPVVVIGDCKLFDITVNKTSEYTNQNPLFEIYRGSNNHQVQAAVWKQKELITHLRLLSETTNM